jgi:transposase
VIVLPVVTVSRILLIVIAKLYLLSARPIRNMIEFVVFIFGVVVVGNTIVTVYVIIFVLPKMSGSI